MRIAVSAVLGLHMLLGNLCVMPMAFAKEMPMPTAMHGESMEMVMTPLVPMSPAHCEHCLKEKNVGMDPMKGMPCNSGHCLTHATPSTSTAIPSTHFSASVALPTLESILSTAPVELHNQPSTAPPATIVADTIVLRL